MAKQFLLRANFLGVWFTVLLFPFSVWGTDPVVRQYLRNIDDKPSDGAPTIQQTMQELERGEIKLPTELDRLFEPLSFVPPDRFLGAELRRWRDNTGAYEVEGRLTMIYPDKVRLTKPTGRTTTVSMQRLSPNDQAYVRWVAGQLVRSSRESGPIDAQERSSLESR